MLMYHTLNTITFKWISVSLTLFYCTFTIINATEHVAVIEQLKLWSTWHYLPDLDLWYLALAVVVLLTGSYHCPPGYRHLLILQDTSSCQGSLLVIRKDNSHMILRNRSASAPPVKSCAINRCLQWSVVKKIIS